MIIFQTILLTLFLDIEMPVLDGLAVGEKLKTLPNPPKIIFSTGFDQFAVRAFELEAFDYILKPYTKTRLQATVIKLQKFCRINLSSSCHPAVIFLSSSLFGTTINF